MKLITRTPPSKNVCLFAHPRLFKTMKGNKEKKDKKEHDPQKRGTGLGLRGETHLPPRNGEFVVWSSGPPLSETKIKMSHMFFSFKAVTTSVIPMSISVSEIVILFGLARRTARKSRKYHYFTHGAGNLVAVELRGVVEVDRRLGRLLPQAFERPATAVVHIHERQIFAHHNVGSALPRGKRCRVWMAAYT